MVFRYSYIYCNLLFIRIIASVITPPPLCIAECRLNAKLIEIDNVALDGAFQPIVLFPRVCKMSLSNECSFDISELYNISFKATYIGLIFYLISAAL